MTTISMNADIYLQYNNNFIVYSSDQNFSNSTAITVN
jgi:hypothetical protein